MAYNINIPGTPFLGPDGRVSQEWLLWLLNPNIIKLASTQQPVAYQYGGTGLSQAPAAGSLLVGTGVAYAMAATLPTAAFPALSGDITTPAGSVATTLATVNASPGTVGDGTHTVQLTVDAKGRTTASAETAITGSPGDFAAVGAITGASVATTAAITAGSTLTATTGFGCNGKTAQTSAAVDSAVAGTAGATYTAAEQGMLNDLKALVNQLRAALVANGVTA